MLTEIIGTGHTVINGIHCPRPRYLTVKYIHMIRTHRQFITRNYILYYEWIEIKFAACLNDFNCNFVLPQTSTVRPHMVNLLKLANSFRGIML